MDEKLKALIWPIITVFLGMLFLYGSYYELTQRKWPYFMPPQIDFFNLFFEMFGKTGGVYVGSLFLFLLGSAVLTGGIYSIWRRCKNA